MKRFVPQFQGRTWPNGARILHVYALPDPDDNAELVALAAACRQAMASYPIAALGDDLLHITIEMSADTIADDVDAGERAELVEALRDHLADTKPLRVFAGSPIAGGAGVLLDIWPDGELAAVQSKVRDALREVRGPAAIQHAGGRMHMSLGYSYDTADSDPLQSALRRITPSHAPFLISSLHLLDVQFSERPHRNATAWQLSWEPVAAISFQHHP